MISQAGAERRRRRYPGQRGEQRAHAIDGVILQLSLGMRRAVEDQQSDGYAPGVEAGDERRHRPGRHEGACAVHIPDGFRHRLAHVSALVED